MSRLVNFIYVFSIMFTYIFGQSYLFSALLVQGFIQIFNEFVISYKITLPHRFLTILDFSFTLVSIAYLVTLYFVIFFTHSHLII